MIVSIGEIQTGSPPAQVVDYYGGGKAIHFNVNEDIITNIIMDAGFENFGTYSDNEFGGDSSILDTVHIGTEYAGQQYDENMIFVDIDSDGKDFEVTHVSTAIAAYENYFGNTEHAHEIEEAAVVEGSKEVDGVNSTVENLGTALLFGGGTLLATSPLWGHALLKHYK